MLDVSSDPEAAAQELRTLTERAHTLSRAGALADAFAAAQTALPFAQHPALPVTAQTVHWVNCLGAFFSTHAHNDRARALFEQAQAMLDHVGAPGDDLRASIANNLGQIEGKAGHFDRAVELLEQAVRLAERGGEPLAIAIHVDNLGSAYRARGELDRAREMHERALGVFSQREGPFGQHLATALGNLSEVHLQRGDVVRAEAFRLRACDAHERTLGLTHPETLLHLRALVEIARVRGDTARAEDLVALLLAHARSMSVETQRFLAEMLDSLAQRALQDFRLDLAERLGTKALELLTAIDGARSPAATSALARLGRIQHASDDLESAQRTLQRALAAYEALGRSGDAADVLVDLGKVYRQWNQHALAVEMLTAAIDRLRKDAHERPGSAGRLASALGNLALLHYERDELEAAEALNTQALAVLDPGERGERAWLLHNRAMLRYHRGHHGEARADYEDAKHLWSETFGADHPFVATTLANLALLHWATGDVAAALDAFAQTNALRDREMRRVLGVGSERKRAAYARGLQCDLHKVITFLFDSAATAPAVARFAADQLLQRKGRVLDAVAATFARLRQEMSEAERRVLDRLQAVRGEISDLVAPTLVLRTPLAHPERLAALRREEEQLEAELSYQAVVDASGLAPVSLDAVRAALPEDVALVDLVKWRTFDPVRLGASGGPWRDVRYAALVVRRCADPRWFDLGPASVVDASADRLRSALRRRASDIAAIDTEASALHTLAIAPLEDALAGARRLVLSPDGKLTLVPFGVLHAPKGPPLSDQYALSYLSAGRDVVRPAEIDGGRGVVVVAAPDYDTAPVGPPPASGADRFADRAGFAPLPGTRAEGEDLAALLDEVTLLTGADATVTAVMQVARPAVLHVATHGIFAPLHEPQLQWTPDLMQIGDRFMVLSQAAPVLKNPMYFSGLALAGANRREGGILTAQAIAALDLRGTALTVLSACETGLGTVEDGEEFAGLRRALSIAGAATQITSLWRVDDEATRALMADYYRLLLEGHGRAEALAAAQVRIASDPEHPEWRHPFYWAAFVSAGDWRPMGDRLVARASSQTGAAGERAD